MSKLALYQKYRSSTFDEVVGQEVTVRTIKNAIKENKVGHAYLFCGPRGTGKTTMARLLAKAVNCENPEEAPCGHCESCIAAANGTHPDIIEINAANETHVDDIRDLIERARLAPMVGKHKVYIIDEVHQLSSAASSALLKTLEEPPENVIFILATTDPQKLLPTIISRCQQFNFYRIKTDQIQNHLLDIAKKENIEMDEGAARKIAILANGGMRDALSIMDQCASFSSDKIQEKDIDRIYGLTSLQEQMDLLQNLFDHDLASVLNRIRSYDESGIDMNRMSDALIADLKDAAVYGYTRQADLLKVLDEEHAKQLSKDHSPAILLKMIDVLMDGKNKFKLAQSASSAFEVVCLETIAAMDAPVETEQVQTVRKPAADKIKAEQKAENKPKPAVSMMQQSYALEQNEEHPVSANEEEVLSSAPIETKTETSSDLSMDDILAILQVCNKDDKSADQQKYSHLNEIMGLEKAKWKLMLNGVVIAASGKDLILFACDNAASASRINSDKENHGLYGFLRDDLHIEKRPYAITSRQFQDAARQFMIRRKNNTLPDPWKCEPYKDNEDIPHQETSEEKVINLFGKENVQII
ncbi:MAG: DNA polymerase III subunit gamma/tau [Lactimicrobium massiliense]|nr:DNA polymerase III subunit gamma/tau [Lactimicrobium massiliense]MDD6560405.1 DNA polymerase III subunit gamma/tau [Lactimicrobium massiliense]